LRRAAGSDGLVCLCGSWAGGGALLAAEPLFVLADADPVAALGVQPRVELAVAIADQLLHSLGQLRDDSVQCAGDEDDAIGHRKSSMPQLCQIGGFVSDTGHIGASNVTER